MIANNYPNSGSATDQSRAFQNKAIEPQQPNLHGRADEVLKWVSELEAHFCSLDASIFGRGQIEKANYIPPTSLEGKLAEACTRIASLCGNASTIVRDIGNN